jgi:hypothetical protein
MSIVNYFLISLFFSSLILEESGIFGPCYSSMMMSKDNLVLFSFFFSLHLTSDIHNRLSGSVVQV